LSFTGRTVYNVQGLEGVHHIAPPAPKPKETLIREMDEGNGDEDGRWEPSLPCLADRGAVLGC
jgi:hypothetical protein